MFVDQHPDKDLYIAAEAVMLQIENDMQTQSNLMKQQQLDGSQQSNHKRYFSELESDQPITCDSSCVKASKFMHVDDILQINSPSDTTNSNKRKFDMSITQTVSPQASVKYDILSNTTSDKSLIIQSAVPIIRQKPFQVPNVNMNGIGCNIINNNDDDNHTEEIMKKKKISNNNKNIELYDELDNETGISTRCIVVPKIYRKCKYI
jgi:hypothetical protein